MSGTSEFRCGRKIEALQLLHCPNPARVRALRRSQKHGDLDFGPDLTENLNPTRDVAENVGVKLIQEPNTGTVADRILDLICRLAAAHNLLGAKD